MLSELFEGKAVGAGSFFNLYDKNFRLVFSIIELYYTILYKK